MASDESFKFLASSQLHLTRQINLAPAEVNIFSFFNKLSQKLSIQWKNAVSTATCMNLKVELRKAIRELLQENNLLAGLLTGYEKLQVMVVRRADARNFAYIVFCHNTIHQHCKQPYCQDHGH